MKLLIKSSKALKNLAGSDGSTRLVEGLFAIAGGGGGRRGKDGDGDGESASSFLTVFGDSSMRTEDMAVEMGGRETEIGGERRRFPPERKGEEMASIVGEK